MTRNHAVVAPQQPTGPGHDRRTRRMDRATEAVRDATGTVVAVGATTAVAVVGTAAAIVSGFGPAVFLVGVTTLAVSACEPSPRRRHLGHRAGAVIVALGAWWWVAQGLAGLGRTGAIVAGGCAAVVLAAVARRAHLTRTRPGAVVKAILADDLHLIRRVAGIDMAMEIDGEVTIPRRGVIRFVLEGPRGVLAEYVGARARELASVFDPRTVETFEVWGEPSKGMPRQRIPRKIGVEVDFSGRRDLTSQPWPGAELTWDAKGERVGVGVDENGAMALVGGPDVNYAVVGQRGTGKSEFLRHLVATWLGAGDTVLIFDGGRSLDLFAGHPGVAAYAYQDEHERLVGVEHLFLELLPEMLAPRRAAWAADTRKRRIAPPAWPRIRIVCDEFSMLTDVDAPADIKRAAKAVANGGKYLRKFGLTFVVADTSGMKDSLPRRVAESISCRVGFYLTDQTEAAALMGWDAMRAGANPCTLPPPPEGVGRCIVAEGTRWRRVATWSPMTDAEMDAYTGEPATGPSPYSGSSDHSMTRHGAIRGVVVERSWSDGEGPVARSWSDDADGPYDPNAGILAAERRPSRRPEPAAVERAASPTPTADAVLQHPGWAPITAGAPRAGDVWRALVDRPGAVSSALETPVGATKSTIDRCLRRLEEAGLATRSRAGKADRWSAAGPALAAVKLTHPAPKPLTTTQHEESKA